jgi:hypothetical protein
MPQPSDTPIFAGLSGLSASPLTRVPVRTRSTSVTLSAWRLEVTSDQGSGSIVLAEAAAGEAYYRGEGIFLGWPQDRLAEVYHALQPPGEDQGLDTPQLG